MQPIKKKFIGLIKHLRYMSRVEHGYSADELHLFIEPQDILPTIEFNKNFVDTLMLELKYIIEDINNKSPKLIHYASDLVRQGNNCNSFRISIVIRNWGDCTTLQIKQVLDDYLQNRTIYELAARRGSSSSTESLLTTLTYGFFRTTAHSSSIDLPEDDIISIAYDYLKPFH